MMAQPVSVRGAPDGRQVELNGHGRGTVAESDGQFPLGEGRPGRTYRVVDDIVRRTLLIERHVLGVRAADLPSEVYAAPLAASLRHAA